MPRYRLTVFAEADFDGIGEYTASNWGLEQAAHYLSELDQAFETLAARSTLGKDRSDLRPFMRAWHCNHHVIFFRRDGDGNVEILRILHERMDFARHL